MKEESQGLLFESGYKNVPYNIKNESFQQPRMFTLRQLRDVFFGLLNISKSTSIQEVHTDDLEDIKKKIAQLMIDD